MIPNKLIGQDIDIYKLIGKTKEQADEQMLEYAKLTHDERAQAMIVGDIGVGRAMPTFHRHGFPLVADVIRDKDVNVGFLSWEQPHHIELERGITVNVGTVGHVDHGQSVSDIRIQHCLQPNITLARRERLGSRYGLDGVISQVLSEKHSGINKERTIEPYTVQDDDGTWYHVDSDGPYVVRLVSVIPPAGGYIDIPRQFGKSVERRIAKLALHGRYGAHVDPYSIRPIEAVVPDGI